MYTRIYVCTKLQHQLLRHMGVEVNDFTEVVALIEVPPPSLYIYT